ncbi:putative transporter [Pseudoloma neurophilia]|uniref:Putative transporter n=1 Tax=Pseudoloma neurophilia TaxID=146866 RepID=A0A0R0LRM9_9MICR|nr:putative transporter [Pseudoloma neurophilia]
MTETAAASGNILLFPEPGYATLSWSDPFSLIVFTIFQVSLIIFIFLPVYFFKGLQEQTVASYLFFLFTSHMVSSIFIAPIIFLPITFLFFIISIIFTRNDKFYNLFSALGASYVLVYLLILLIGIQSNIIVPFCLFSIITISFIILKKANRELHFGILSGIMTGMAGNILLSNLTPLDLITKGHHSSKIRFLNGVFVWLLFLVIGGITFLWMVYKDKLKEKYKEFKEKHSGKTNE